VKEKNQGREGGRREWGEMGGLRKTERRREKEGSMNKKATKVHGSERDWGKRQGLEKEIIIGVCWGFNLAE